MLNFLKRILFHSKKTNNNIEDNANLYIAMYILDLLIKLKTSPNLRIPKSMNDSPSAWITNLNIMIFSFQHDIDFLTGKKALSEMGTSEQWKYYEGKYLFDKFFLELYNKPYNKDTTKKQDAR